MRLLRFDKGLSRATPAGKQEESGLHARGALFVYILCGVLVPSIISLPLFGKNLFSTSSISAILFQVSIAIFLVFCIMEVVNRRLVALACVIGLFLFIGFRCSLGLVDDTFIALRYAQNFAQGNGLVFNVGEKVEGYTCFLWVVILGLIKRIMPAIDLPSLSKALGIFFGALTLALIYRFSVLLSEEEEGNGSFISQNTAYLLPLVAVNLPLLFWSFSGMETSLYLFELTGACYFFCTYQRGSFRRENLAASALLFALALLTRPETYLFLIVPFAFIILCERRKSARSLLIFYLPIGVIYGPYFIWRYTYYGYLFPNTYYAKVGALTYPIVLTGIDYLKSQGIPFLVFLIPIMTGVIRKKGVLRQEEYFLLSILGLQIISIILTGGDHFVLARYFVYMLPFLYLLSFDEIGNYISFVVDAVSKRRSRIGGFLKRQTVCVACILLFLGLFWYGAWGVDAVRIAGRQVANWKLIAQWLEQNTSKDDVVASPIVGAVGYYCDRTMVDMLGITDAVIGHTIIRPGEGPRDHERFNTQYLLNRKPTYIFLFCAARNEEEFLRKPSWIPAIEDLKRYFPNKDYEFIVVSVRGENYTLYRRVKN